MGITDKGSDGRIRIRCHECGKRLKLPPGAGGRVFRCPICANTIISPLDSDPAATEQKDQAEAKIMKRLSGWAPVLSQKERYKSVESLGHFLGREFADLAQSYAGALAGVVTEESEALDKVQALYREKMARTREFARRIITDLSREISEMERNPMQKQLGFAERLEGKRREKRDFEIILKVLFDISMSPPATLASAPEQPPAQPGAQTEPIDLLPPSPPEQ